jgi:DNA-binding response OmpR family regulator
VTLPLSPPEELLLYGLEVSPAEGKNFDSSPAFPTVFAILRSVGERGNTDESHRKRFVRRAPEPQVRDAKMGMRSLPGTARPAWGYRAIVFTAALALNGWQQAQGLSRQPCVGRTYRVYNKGWTFMARILLVEDDPALSRGIIALLKAAGHAADTAKDGETALFLAEAEPCSLVILDIGLPDMSGFEVLKKLRARACKTPVLILSARDHVTDRVKGLDLGADDYLLKPFDASELGARVRALLRRDHGDPCPVLVIGNLTIDRSRATAEICGRPLQLRRREWAVLDRLTAKVGDIVSKEKLMAEVFSYDDAVAPNAVEVYVARLRRKLEPDGPSIKTMRGLGYMLTAS